VPPPLVPSGSGASGRKLLDGGKTLTYLKRLPINTSSNQLNTYVKPSVYCAYKITTESWALLQVTCEKNSRTRPRYSVMNYNSQAHQLKQNTLSPSAALAYRRI